MSAVTNASHTNIKGVLVLEAWLTGIPTLQEIAVSAIHSVCQDVEYCHDLEAKLIYMFKTEKTLNVIIESREMNWLGLHIPWQQQTYPLLAQVQYGLLSTFMGKTWQRLVTIYF